jgi:hypothetical protein
MTTGPARGIAIPLSDGVPFMRPILVGFTAFALSVGVASAQLNPFVGNNLLLDNSDLALIDEIVSGMLHGGAVSHGTSIQWHNGANNRHGSITVLGSSQKDGQPCHKLRYAVPIQTAQRTRNYDLTWCKTSNDEWKIVM